MFKNKDKFFVIWSIYFVITALLILYYIFDAIQYNKCFSSYEASRNDYYEYVFINGVIPYHNKLVELSNYVISEGSDIKVIENAFHELQLYSSGSFQKFAIFSDDINKKLEYHLSSNNKLFTFRKIIQLEKKYPNAFNTSQIDNSDELDTYIEELMKILN